MNCAVAGLLEIGNIDSESISVLLRVVCQRAAGNDGRVLVAVKRLRHPKGLENIRGGKFRQRLAANAFHDDRKQKESAVAIKPFGARFEVQAFLASDYAERVLVRRDVVDVHTG